MWSEDTHPEPLSSARLKEVFGDIGAPRPHKKQKITRNTKLTIPKARQVQYFEERKENRAAVCHLHAAEPIPWAAFLHIFDIRLLHNSTTSTKSTTTTYHNYHNYNKLATKANYVMIPSEPQRIIAAPASVASSIVEFDIKKLFIQPRTTTTPRSLFTNNRRHDR